jgi:hypothetical protein
MHQDVLFEIKIKQFCDCISSRCCSAALLQMNNFTHKNKSTF